MSDSDENIWALIDIKVKNYIQRLLKHCGFDDFVNLLKIDEKKLSELELFVQKLHKNVRMKNPELLREYF